MKLDGPSLRLLAMLGAAALASACQSPDPTHAVVVNDYPAKGSQPGARTVVYKAWWSVVLFADPVLASESSDELRVVPDRAYAYALLARDWDPDAGAPRELIPVRSRDELDARQGHTLEITIAPNTVDGDCATGHALSQKDADFITQRIFSGDFAGRSYEAKECAVVAAESDGGMIVHNAEALDACRDD